MKILVADDEQLALDYLVKTIKAIVPDSEINSFIYPAEVLAFANDHSVDIAFLDIEMNDENGITLAAKLRKINPKVRLVFVTGYSQYALDAFAVHADGYILKPASKAAVQEEIDNIMLTMDLNQTDKIRVHTFGNFEFLVDNKPLFYKRAKAKELLAFLVDRKGSSVTTAEIISVLWEDKEYSRSLQKQYQNVVTEMMNSLKEAGVEDVIIRSRNALMIDVSKINCDYYHLLEGDAKAIDEYVGEYMTNYSWGENTNGMLWEKYMNKES